MPVGSIDSNKVNELLSQNQKTNNTQPNEHVKNDFVKSPTQDTVQFEENNNNKKLVYGIGGVVALIALGILGHKGYLGEGIQKFLGGAKKAAETETKKTEEEVKKTFQELYNDAIKNKKESIKNETTGRTHTFEYNKDGKLVKETVSKGDDYVIYENVKFQKSNGETVDKMKIIEIKKDGATTIRPLDENSVLMRPKREIKTPETPKTETKIEPNTESQAKAKAEQNTEAQAEPKTEVKPTPKNNIIEPEVPIKAKTPSQIYQGELPKDLKPEEIPQALDKNLLNELLSKKARIKRNGSIFELGNNKIEQFIYKDGKIDAHVIYDIEGNVKNIKKNNIRYNPDGTIEYFSIKSYDSNNKYILQECFNRTGKLRWYEAITVDGRKVLFNSDGKILRDRGPGSEII